MRIDRLDLIAFGPFRDLTLDLSAGKEGLHLIYGPNEAGKSSALRAIKQFFHGIPQQSNDDFVHHYSKMQIGAVLRDRSGGTLELIRRKGTKNTLLNPDGSASDDAIGRLGRFLGEVAPEDFLRRFLIDHSELIDGGNLLADGKGDLDQALFATSTGEAGAGAARVQRTLEAEAEKLFKHRGSQPVINQHLDELKKTKETLARTSLPSSVWHEQEESLHAQKNREKALKQQLQEDRAERDRLKQQRKAREQISGRQDVIERLSQVANAPPLFPGFTPQRIETMSELHAERKRETDASASIARFTEELSRLSVPEPLLEHADAIESCHQRLPIYQQDAELRAELETKRTQLEAAARVQLRELGRDPGLLNMPERLEALRPKKSDRVDVRELAGKHQALVQAVNRAEKDLKSHNQRRAKRLGEAKPLGPERSPSALRAAVENARKHGDLDARLNADLKVLDEKEAKASSKLSALGYWTGTLEQVETLVPPSIDTILEFEHGFKQARDEADDLRRQSRSIEDAARATEDQLERLQRGGDIATDDAQVSIRAERDAIWQAIKQADAWDNGRAEDYERAVLAADDLADRRFNDVKRIHEYTGLLVDRDRFARDREVLIRRLKEAEERFGALQRRWQVRWSSVGIHEPGPPSEMRAWCTRQAELVSLIEAAREQRQSHAAQQEQIRIHRLELNAALLDLGEPVAALNELLGSLITRAQDVIADVEAETSERKRIQKDLQDHDLHRPELETTLATAHADLERWQVEWAAAMSRIDERPDSSPTAMNTHLDLIGALFENSDKARDHQLEINRIISDGSRFTADVRDLASLTAPELVPEASSQDEFKPATVMTQLNDRLKKARLARLNHENLSKQLADAEEAKQSADSIIAEKRARLETLCREARCDAVDDLPAVEEQSQRRQKLEEKLDGINSHLRLLADGKPLDAFLAEAQQIDPSSLAARIDELDERIDTLSSEHEALLKTIGGAENDLAKKRDNPLAEAADASQQAEDLRAKINEEAEQYIRLKLASAVLRKGIELYRDKAKGPVVHRAGELFSELTRGSFEGLRVGYDDDKPVLKGVRAGSQELIDIQQGMSDGTKDQLYLALRLATLETYLDRHESLPLVVDDILIQFDNDRTRSTLAVLAQLSARTQVLVFTHHEHLLNLARDPAVVPPNRLFIHRLPDPGSPLREPTVIARNGT